MAVALPTGDMLETPPGYPFEEINYEDIEVEEVGRLAVVVVVVVLTSSPVLLQEEKWQKMITPSQILDCPY